MENKEIEFYELVHNAFIKNQKREEKRINENVIAVIGIVICLFIIVLIRNVL